MKFIVNVVAVVGGNRWQEMGFACTLHQFQREKKRRKEEKKVSVFTTLHVVLCQIETKKKQQTTSHIATARKT